jgi:hypothetical protein
MNRWLMVYQLIFLTCNKEHKIVLSYLNKSVSVLCMKRVIFSSIKFCLTSK